MSGNISIKVDIFFFTLQNEVRKAQKKIAEQNLKISVKVATEAAESAASDGKTFCIIQLDVGLDAAAVREAVSKVMEKKVNLHLLLLTTLRKGKRKLNKSVVGESCRECR